MTVFIAKALSLTGDKETPPNLSRELRRADQFIRYGVLAAYEILGNTITEYKFETGSCGLFMGSSYGPMETNFDVLDQVVNSEQTSPTLFSHSVFNAAAGYLARIFQLHGCALTITDFGFPFFRALQQAILSIECGQISSCLVLQIETFSLLLNDTRSTFFQNEMSDWYPGACVWLLTDKRERSQSHQIDSFNLETRTTPPENYLKFEERLDINKKMFPMHSPLDAVVKISETLNDDTLQKCSFTLTAPYGEMLLTTSS